MQVEEFHFKIIVAICETENSLKTESTKRGNKCRIRRNPYTLYMHSVPHFNTDLPTWMCNFTIKIHTHTQTVLWVTYSIYAIVHKTGSGRGMFFTILARLFSGQTLQ